MAEKYYSILTNRGKELEAQSSATGKPVIIKDFVPGYQNRIHNRSARAYK